MTLGGLRAGCTEGLSFAVEAGSLLSQCWVGYNGSLCRTRVQAHRPLLMPGSVRSPHPRPEAPEAP